MRLSRYTPMLLAVLVLMLAWPFLVGNASGRPAAWVPSAEAGRHASVTLGDRRLDVSAPTITPTTTPGLVQVSVAVTVTNTGDHSFVVHPHDFSPAAEGDIFRQRGGSGASATLTGRVGPGQSRTGQLTFAVPSAAVPELALLYHPPGHHLLAAIPLGSLPCVNCLLTPTPVPPTPTSMATDTPVPPTPTSTPTSTPVPPTSTSTPAAPPVPTVGTVQEYSLWSGGSVGDVWGTAVDAAGNVWFAEPGCDFAPTCASSTPPGQIGELPAGSSTPRFFTLPNITGNQPIFVALDSAGHVWFTTPNNDMIGEFEPSSQSFVGQWPVTPGSGPWDLTFDQTGKLWYTEHLASAVGAFDPSTHSHTDFSTPSADSNPYGITASGNLIWFTENNSSVARIAKLDTSAPKQIAEYPIRQDLTGGAVTPHMIGVDANGHPWWTPGWAPYLGTLDPGAAAPGQCGTASSPLSDCTGVTEVALPPPPSSCNSNHVSGLAVQGGSTSRIWFDNSLSNQVGVYTPSTNPFAVDNLSCGVHPHDGLNLVPAQHVWWDEEFANALGELTP